MRLLALRDGDFTICDGPVCPAWGIAPHVADKILNHQTGSITGVAAVYQRHDFLVEGQKALEIWGRMSR